MAIRCSFPYIAVSEGNLNKNPATRVFMLHENHMPPNRSSTALSRSMAINKIFEDQSRGIICYRDDCGEVICEGYDEGPRFCKPALQTILRQREFQMLDFLQARLQIFEGSDVCCIKQGVAVQEDLDH
ncbi:uncharacterized protein LOC143880857 isoform X2 [Tasmannia lanceolata]|uniref:uncharacterized protein LOC143880857 isoform X2 n=1 Tax=Tasmannia lanceolata TaxID=3420 RepID=UPI00406440DF